MSENASDHGLGQGRGVLVGEQEGSCMAGGSMAQGPAVSIGQRGAVDRAGRWGGTWQVPVLALASTSCVPSGKSPPSLGLRELLI